MRPRSTTMRRRLLAIIAVASGCALVAACGDSASGDDSTFPNETINLYIGYDTGGSADGIAREYAQILTDEYGVPVQVHNRPGASGSIATSEVLGQEADGHTIALAPNSQLTTSTILNADDITYSGPDDWTNIGGILLQQNGLMAQANRGWETLEDFLDEAREHPGELTVGVSSVAGSNGVSVASLMDQADVDLVIVPFSGGAGESVVAVLGGQVDAMHGTLSGQLGMLESGELMSLGHTGDRPYDSASSEPYSEYGYDVPWSSTYYMYAPPGLPEDIEAALADVHQTVINSDAFQEFVETNDYVLHPVNGEEMREELIAGGDSAEAGIRLLREAGMDLD